MASLGATRWVMPLEMRASDLAVVQKAAPAGLQTEVFAYGRMPLAFSARCFTARHYNLPKDDCGFRCIEHADGQLLKSRGGRGLPHPERHPDPIGQGAQPDCRCAAAGKPGGGHPAHLAQGLHTGHIVAAFDAAPQNQHPAGQCGRRPASPLCLPMPAMATGMAAPAWSWSRPTLTAA